MTSGYLEPMTQDHTHPNSALQALHSSEHSSEEIFLESAVQRLKLSLMAASLAEKYLCREGKVHKLLSGSKQYTPKDVHEVLQEIDHSVGSSFLKEASSIPEAVLGELLKHRLPEIKVSDIPPEHLGFLYESHLESRSSQKNGVYYTPLSIVKDMVKETLEPHLTRAPIIPLSICDPACGSGYFLIEALRQLSASPSLIETALQQGKAIFYGVDLDPLAISLTDFCLRLEMLSLGNSKLKDQECQSQLIQLRVGNSLIDEQDVLNSDETFTALSWDREFPDVQEVGFDCIIGNPPYGLKRGDKISDGENEILKRKYSQFRAGKVNKYLLFMARSKELLSESGSMSFIVPNAWLGIRSGSPLRKAWIESRCLKKVNRFTYKVFPKLAVEAVVFLVDNSRKHSSIEINRYYVDGRQESQRLIPTHVIELFADRRIPLTWTKGTGDIVQSIFDRGTLLKSDNSPFEPLIALQAYAKGKGDPPQSRADVKNHVFHSREQKGSDYYPYYRGSDIRPFHINWSGEYLRHGPFLAEPQTLDRFSGPRVVVREVLGTRPYLLTACFLDSPALYNKSVLHILSKGVGATTNAKALACILNSEFASFVIAALGRKSARNIFPKIVADDLKEFPLPKTFRARAEELSKLYDEYVVEESSNDGFRERVDQLVYEVYQISSNDTAEMKKLIQSF